jgi:hypothetical protein
LLCGVKNATVDSFKCHPNLSCSLACLDRRNHKLYVLDLTKTKDGFERSSLDVPAYLINLDNVRAL